MISKIRNGLDVRVLSQNLCSYAGSLVLLTFFVCVNGFAIDPNALAALKNALQNDPYWSQCLECVDAKETHPFSNGRNPSGANNLQLKCLVKKDCIYVCRGGTNPSRWGASPGQMHTPNSIYYRTNNILPEFQPPGGATHGHVVALKAGQEVLFSQPGAIGNLSPNLSAAQIEVPVGKIEPMGFLPDGSPKTFSGPPDPLQNPSMTYRMPSNLRDTAGAGEGAMAAGKIVCAPPVPKFAGRTSGSPGGIPRIPMLGIGFSRAPIVMSAALMDLEAAAAPWVIPAFMAWEIYQSQPVTNQRGTGLTNQHDMNTLRGLPGVSGRTSGPEPEMEALCEPLQVSKF